MSRRHVFIVSRSFPGLYTYLRAQFSPDADVEIILDRRRGERRRESGTPVVDRRRVARRTRTDVDAELRSTSHVMLTLRDVGRTGDGGAATPDAPAGD